MALLYRGQALQAEGKYAEAEKSYAEFLEKVPQSAEAQNGIAGCRMALAGKTLSRNRTWSRQETYSNHLTGNTRTMIEDDMRQRGSDISNLI